MFRCQRAAVDDSKDVLFTTSTELKSLKHFVMRVLGVSEDTETILDALDLDNLNVEMSVATADVTVESTSYKKGITITGDTKLSGDMAMALSAGEETVAVTFNIHLPELAHILSDVEIVVTSHDTNIAHNIQLLDTTLSLSAAKDTDVSLQAKMTLSVRSLLAHHHVVLLIILYIHICMH